MHQHQARCTAALKKSDVSKHSSFQPWSHELIKAFHNDSHLSWERGLYISPQKPQVNGYIRGFPHGDGGGEGVTF